MSKVVLRKFFKSYTPKVKNQHEQYFRGGYIHNTVILPTDTFQVKNNTKPRPQNRGRISLTWSHIPMWWAMTLEASLRATL